MNKQIIAKKIRSVLNQKFQRSYATRGWQRGGKDSGYFHIVEGFIVSTRYPQQVVVRWREHNLLPIKMTMHSTTPQGMAAAHKLAERYENHAMQYRSYLAEHGFECEVSYDELGIAYVSVKGELQ